MVEPEPTASPPRARRPAKPLPAPVPPNPNCTALQRNPKSPKRRGAFGTNGGPAPTRPGQRHVRELSVRGVPLPKRSHVQPGHGQQTATTADAKNCAHERLPRDHATSAAISTTDRAMTSPAVWACGCFARSRQFIAAVWRVGDSVRKGIGKDDLFAGAPSAGQRVSSCCPRFGEGASPSKLGLAHPRPEMPPLSRGTMTT